jgi:hypothetical protein
MQEPVMDLNYLLSRHQIALMRADVADCTEAAIAHRGMAREYAKRIRVLQRLIGAEGTSLRSA